MECTLSPCEQVTYPEPRSQKLTHTGNVQPAFQIQQTVTCLPPCFRHTSSCLRPDLAD